MPRRIRAVIKVPYPIMAGSVPNYGQIIAKAFMVGRIAPWQKGRLSGVVGFGRFVPDSGSVAILTAIVNLP